MSLKNRIFILIIFLHYCHQDYCMEGTLFKEDIANSKVANVKADIDVKFQSISQQADVTKQTLLDFQTKIDPTYQSKQKEEVLETTSTYLKDEFSKLFTLKRYQNGLFQNWQKNKQNFATDTTLLIPFSKYLDNISNWLIIMYKQFNILNTTYKPEPNKLPTFTVDIPSLKDFTNPEIVIDLSNREETLSSKIITNFPSAIFFVYIKYVIDGLLPDAMAKTSNREKKSEFEKIYKDLLSASEYHENNKTDDAIPRINELYVDLVENINNELRNLNQIIRQNNEIITQKQQELESYRTQNMRNDDQRIFGTISFLNNCNKLQKDCIEIMANLIKNTSLSIEQRNVFGKQYVKLYATALFQIYEAFKKDQNFDDDFFMKKDQLLETIKEQIKKHEDFVAGINEMPIMDQSDKNLIDLIVKDKSIEATMQLLHELKSQIERELDKRTKLPAVPPVTPTQSKQQKPTTQTPHSPNPLSPTEQSTSGNRLTPGNASSTEQKSTIFDTIQKFLQRLFAWLPSWRDIVAKFH